MRRALRWLVVVGVLAGGLVVGSGRAEAAQVCLPQSSQPQVCVVAAEGDDDFWFTGVGAILDGPQVYGALLACEDKGRNASWAVLLFTGTDQRVVELADVGRNCPPIV